MSDSAEKREREKEEREEKLQKELAIVREIQIDPDMLKDLTPQDWFDYNCPYYKLEKLEGNYLEIFDRKVREGGITVIEKFRSFIEEHGVPMRGMDPRTGIYGMEHAAAGFYSAGIRYMEKGNIDKAMVNFAKAIELHPRHVPARGKMAECYYMKRDFLRAGTEIWNAIQLNPVRLQEKNGIGKDHVKEMEKIGIGTYPGAHDWYKNKLVEHLTLEGLIYLFDEDWDSALEDFEEAIRREPNVVNAYYGRFRANMKLEEWEKVIPDANLCIKADYEKPIVLECRGVAYEQLERFDEAIADFDTVLALDANMKTTYLHRSYCYYMKKEYEKALDDAAEAIRRGNDGAYYQRGAAYSELGEYDKAIADFDKALELFDFENEWYLLGDEDYITNAREKAIKLKTGVSGDKIEQNKEPV